MKEKLREEGTHAVNENHEFLEDLIVESRLGRALRDDETVFHRNGSTLDNRNANLYVVEFSPDDDEDDEDQSPELRALLAQEAHAELNRVH